MHNEVLCFPPYLHTQQRNTWEEIIVLSYFNNWLCQLLPLMVIVLQKTKGSSSHPPPVYPQSILHLSPPSPSPITTHSNPSLHLYILHIIIMIYYFNFLKACGATQWSTQCKKSKYQASQSPSPNLAIRPLHASYSLVWAGQCFAQEALRAGRWSTTSSSDCYYCDFFSVCACSVWCVSSMFESCIVTIVSEWKGWY